MYRLFYIVLSIVAIVACVTACNPRDTLDRIDAAEAVADSLPDSAFSLLHKVDPARLHGWETPARYALAYTAAQIKCGIHVDDDSLIRIAVDYYRPDSTVEHMRSLYYLAQICQNANKLPAATKHYTDAEKIALSLNDHLYLGLIYRGLADVYSETSMTRDGEEYSQKSLYHFSRHGDPRFIRYALADLARLSKPERTIELADSAFFMAQEANDSACMAFSLELKSSSLYLLNDYVNAQKNFNYLIHEFPTFLNSADFIWLGATYHYLNNEDSCTYYLYKAENCLTSSDDSLAFFYEKYSIAFDNDRLKEAMKALEECQQIQNRLMAKAYTQSAAIAQRDYFKEENVRTRQQLEKSRLVILTLIFSTLFVAIIIFLYIRHTITVKNLKIAENIRMLFELNERFEQLRNGNSDRLAHVSNAGIETLSLFKDQIALVSKICRQISYQSSIASDKSKTSKIERDTLKLLEENCPTDETFTKFEHIIDSLHDNIISRLRDEITNLTERECRLFCCLVAKFSAPETALFLGEDINNVYRLKSRLKKRIAEADTIHKDTFESYFS